MGYEMSKPNLRAELEADLKLVSEGRKDKWSVLQHHIQKYKSVFIESVRKAKKLVSFVLFRLVYIRICVMHRPYLKTRRISCTTVNLFLLHPACLSDLPSG